MGRLWQYARRYRRRWLWGCALLLCTNATTMAIPQLFRFAIDTISASEDIGPRAGTLGHLRDLALMLVLMAVGGAIFRVLSRRHIFFGARDVELDLRCAFYAHLTRQSASFFGRHPTGDLMSRATSDLGQVRLLLGPGILNTFNTTIAYATALPLMILISPKLTAISLAVYPPSLILMRYLARLLYVRNLDQQRQMGEVSSMVQENLSGAHVVRAFGLESAQEARFDTRNQAYYGAAVRLAWARSGLWRLVVALSSTGVLLAVFFGAHDVLAGRISLGDLVALVEYMALLSWPTFALGWLLSMWQRGAAAMERIGGIMGEAPEIASGDLEPDALNPAVVVNDLTVGYEPERPVLHGVDLDIAPGQTLGVVGPVGAGKSTLVRSIMRLVDVPRGAVFVGGYDVTELDLNSLRGAFAYVPQAPVLFSKTLAQNVAFGRPDAGEDELLAVLERAALRFDLEALPQGLATPVGERGITLSGGQKQRTAIARALLLAAPILILDDALSSVDAETEQRILDQLREERQGKTTIIVAHRVTAVAHADEIVVLDDGHIVERGAHRALCERGGLYNQMARQQELETGHHAREDEAPARVGT